MNLTQKLITRRLILKLINQNDFEAFTKMIDDTDVIKNLKFISNGRTEMNANDLFMSIIESYNSNTPIIALIIFNKESGNYIGLCGLLPSEDDYRAECFYTILPLYRGNGYAIEAMKKLFEYAFKELNFARILLFIHPTNSRGWKVAERVGMKYLGQMTHKDKLSKMMYFSIDKAEFDSQGDY
ncbi:MAG: GNAT family N-acetyltransferase [Promethearchaeota archaeon]